MITSSSFCNFKFFTKSRNRKWMLFVIFSTKSEKCQKGVLFGFLRVVKYFQLPIAPKSAIFRKIMIFRKSADFWHLLSSSSSSAIWKTFSKMFFSFLKKKVSEIFFIFMIMMMKSFSSSSEKSFLIMNTFAKSFFGKKIFKCMYDEKTFFIWWWNTFHLLTSFRVHTWCKKLKTFFSFVIKSFRTSFIHVWS